MSHSICNDGKRNPAYIVYIVHVARTSPESPEENVHLIPNKAKDSLGRHCFTLRLIRSVNQFHI